MPSELVFIFKAMHIIGLHNRKNGGTTRERLLIFTDYSIEGGENSKTSFLYKSICKIMYRIRLFVFEKMFWLYLYIYGFKEY